MLKQRYELLKKQKQEVWKANQIYPKSLIIDRWYNELYNYYESVSTKHNKNNTSVNYYYRKLLYTITLYCYSVVVLFCKYDLGKEKEQERRKFRYNEKGHGKASLTEYEIKALERDFDIDMGNFFVLAPLTKEEWDNILNKRCILNIMGKEL